MQLGQVFPFAFALQLRHLDFDLVDLLFDACRALGYGFFGFPHFFQVGELLLQIAQFFLHQFQAFFGCVVVFFFQRCFFNFQLDNAAIELVHAFGHGFAFHLNQRRCFVYQVNRFVRQEAVGDVTR